MERLTNKKEADAQRRQYENRRKNGYPRNIPEERFLKRSAYEDTGLDPEDVGLLQRANGLQAAAMNDLLPLWTAKNEGRLVILPCKMGSSVYTIKEDFFNCDECEYGAESHYNPKIMRRSCDMDNHDHCPLKVVEHTVSGFEVSSGLHREPKISGPGEWGYEGLEEFRGYDLKWYLTREEAEAALIREGK